MFHLHADRLGQKIPPLDALEDEIDKRIGSGESEEDVTLAVIEDFERSAATVNARTTPLVPASGIVVTGADVEEMTAGVFIMEDNARRTAIAAAMGRFETLGAAEMEEIEAEIFKTRGPVGRIWALCEAEAAKAG